MSEQMLFGLYLMAAIDTALLVVIAGALWNIASTIGKKP